MTGKAFFTKDEMISGAHMYHFFPKGQRLQEDILFPFNAVFCMVLDNFTFKLANNRGLNVLFLTRNKYFITANFQELY